MKIYIFTDLEGITGIYSKEQVLSTGSKYAEGRSFMTHDVNTVAEACKEAGAEEVWVRDGHGAGGTLLYDRLSPAVDWVIQGATPRERMTGLSGCDAVILLGYHAMAGTESAVLEHSMSSAAIQNYWINGKKAGETAIDAGIAGEYGKPVILVTGDDKLCAEAEDAVPGVVTAMVKKGTSSFGSVMLPRHRADALLRQKTIDAIRRAPEIHPVIYPSPVRLRVELVERINTPTIMAKPYMTLIDGRTFEVEGRTMSEALARAGL